MSALCSTPSRGLIPRRSAVVLTAAGAAAGRATRVGQSGRYIRVIDSIAARSRWRRSITRTQCANRIAQGLASDLVSDRYLLPPMVDLRIVGLCNCSRDRGHSAATRGLLPARRRCAGGIFDTTDTAIRSRARRQHCGITNAESRVDSRCRLEPGGRYGRVPSRHS